MRYVTPVGPAEVGTRDGLAYSLWLPEGAPEAGLVILRGAGSCKERHHDFARAARSAGLAAVCFDQRGHGASEGTLDARLLDDVATVADLLGDVPVALRGSSIGRLRGDPGRRAHRRARRGRDLPTAPSSTTPSCREWRCAGCAARCAPARDPGPQRAPSTTPRCSCSRATDQG